MRASLFFATLLLAPAVLAKSVNVVDAQPLPAGFSTTSASPDGRIVGSFFDATASRRSAAFVDAGDNLAGADTRFEIAIVDAPLALPDNLDTDKNTELVLAAPGVLANDQSPSGTKIAALVDDVQHGTLTLGADGGVSYVPESGYAGPDAFTYTVSDGTTTSAPATVTIVVRERAPLVTPASFTHHFAFDELAWDEPAPGVLASVEELDGDPVTVVEAGDPIATTNGVVVVAADGSFEYVPQDNSLTSQESFTLHVTDGFTDPVALPVQLNVGNSPPVAALDAYAYHSLLDEDFVLTKDAAAGVLANDTDDDNDDRVLVVDTFTYLIADGLSAPVTGSVEIEVQDGAPTPTADEQSFTRDPDLASTFFLADPGVLANDTDPEDDELFLLDDGLEQRSAHGSYIWHVGGGLTYTPDDGFVGDDVIPYTVTDGRLQANSSITIAVSAAPAGEDVRAERRPCVDVHVRRGAGGDVRRAGVPVDHGDGVGPDDARAEDGDQPVEGRRGDPMPAAVDVRDGQRHRPRHRRA
jgi:hypothetical protein